MTTAREFAKRPARVIVAIATAALLFSLAAPAAPARSAEGLPFYNAAMEPPPGRILNGWGRFSSEWDKGAADGAGDAKDLESFERAMKPYAPSLISFDTALDRDLMPGFAQRYRQFARNKGFFIAQIGVDFRNAQRDASQGMRDPEIVMLMDTIREAGNPALIRIGYEFNNPSIPYDPSLYIMAFRKVVDRLREAHLDRAATVWNATAAGFGGPHFMRWYPGDDVVDWWGISLFDPGDFSNPQLDEFLADARAHRKPVIICEASPVFQTSTPGRVRGPKSGAEAAAWYGKLAALIQAHPEINAVAVVSVDWRRLAAILPGKGWPDARIERWPDAVAEWKKAVSNPRFIGAGDAEAIYRGRK